MRATCVCVWRAQHRRKAAPTDTSCCAIPPLFSLSPAVPTPCHAPQLSAELRPPRERPHLPRLLRQDPRCVSPTVSAPPPPSPPSPPSPCTAILAPSLPPPPGRVWRAVCGVRAAPSEGNHIVSRACGAAHTMFLCRARYALLRLSSLTHTHTNIPLLKNTNPPPLPTRSSRPHSLRLPPFPLPP